MVALLAVLTTQAATQDGEREPGTIIFQIPSQPLEAALQAYSQVSGVEVLYESQIAAGLQSAPVEGAFAPEVALRLLLASTDLAVHYNRSNAITLALPADLALPPANPLGGADQRPLPDDPPSREDHPI